MKMIAQEEVLKAQLDAAKRQNRMAIATSAMQGLIYNNDRKLNLAEILRESVQYADALLKELGEE